MIDATPARLAVAFKIPLPSHTVDVEAERPGDRLVGEAGAKVAAALMALEAVRAARLGTAVLLTLDDD